MKTLKGKVKKGTYSQADTDAMKAMGLKIPSEDEAGCMVCHGGDSPFTEKVDPKHKFNFKERLEDTHKHIPLKKLH